MSTPRQQDIERFLGSLGFTQSPDMSGSGNSLITSTTVTGQCDQFDAYEVLDSIRDQRTPFGFYASHQITTGPGYDVISITFEDINIGVDGTTSRFNITTRMINRPIEEHPNYKVIWNHNIVGPVGTVLDTTEYGFWATRSTLGPVAGGTAGVYWAKSNQALSKDPIVLVDDSPQFYASATKPGVQSYLIPAPVVVATIYTRDEIIMENYVAIAGELIAPGKTFGLETGNEYWLAASPQTRKVNDWYEINVEYMYVPQGWDTDIY